MNLLAPILGGLASSLAGGLFGSKANAADAAAAKQADLQDQIVQYLIGRQKNTYDPLMNRVVLPALTSRVTQGPSWSSMAQANERRLQTPFALNY